MRREPPTLFVSLATLPLASGGTQSPDFAEVKQGQRSKHNEENGRPWGKPPKKLEILPIYQNMRSWIMSKALQTRQETHIMSVNEYK